MRQNIQTRVQKADPEVDDKNSAKCDQDGHVASCFAKHAGILREKLRAQVEKAAQDINDKAGEVEPFADSNAETSENNSDAPNDKQVEFTADQDNFIAKMLNDNSEGEDGSQGSESDNKSETLDNDTIANDNIVADDESEALDDDAIANDDLVADDEPETLGDDTIVNANPNADDEPEVSDSIDDAESNANLQANDANKKMPLPALDSQINNLLNQQFQDTNSPHTDSKNSHLTD